MRGVLTPIAGARYWLVVHSLGNLHYYLSRRIDPDTAGSPGWLLPEIIIGADEDVDVSFEVLVVRTAGAVSDRYLKQIES